MGSVSEQFESRKRDHVKLASTMESQTSHLSLFHRVNLIHEALPELNMSEVTLDATLFSERIPVPLFVSSMTAGHEQGEVLNHRIAEVAEARGWVMGVGSQRKQLFDAQSVEEWVRFRTRFPKLKLLGNIGLSQLIQSDNEVIKDLASSLNASGMVIHTNALQEALQPEGTPLFRGGLKRLEELAKNVQIPIVLKETGCGFSKRTFQKLKGTGIKAVDVSGLGGTHWGRIEGKRQPSNSIQSRAAETFKDWGNSTVDSLLWAQGVKPDYEIWASGGVRTGLDAAKCFGLGARLVGIAQPIIKAAQLGTKELHHLFECFEYELKLAMFCTGSRTVQELRNNIEVRDGP